MFRNKKLLTMLFVAMLVLALCLTSCGNNGNEGDTSTPPADTGNGDANANGSDTTAADEVVIGFIGPITGTNAAEGAAARNAFMMAIDEANASGEFPYTIRVNPMDDQSTDSVAVTAANQIVSEPNVVAASGFWNSGPAQAAIPVFIQNEVPLLIWGAIKEDLTNENNVPWITRSAPTDKQENIPLAEKVLDEMGYTDWFVVSDLSSYGAGNYDAFLAELASRNIEPLGKTQVPADSTDLNAVVAQIKSSNAKAVYCGSIVNIASQLKRQLYEAGVTDILFCGISGMKTEDFLKIDADAAEGALVVSPGVILDQTAEGRKFVEDYNTKGFSEPIGAYTPYAYEAALILLNALRDCGANPTPEAMCNAILSSSTTGIMGTTEFNEIGQTTNVAAYLNVVQDGKWVPLDDSEYADGTRSFGGQ